MFVFNAAFDGEQRAGARFRPETPNPSQPRKTGCTLAVPAAGAATTEYPEPRIEQAERPRQSKMC